MFSIHAGYTPLIHANYPGKPPILPPRGVKKPAGGGRAKVASIVMFMVPTLDAGKGLGIGVKKGYSDGCAESLIVWDAHHA